MIGNWPKSSLDKALALQAEYASKTVCVTGGASFIGSHLVEALLTLGSKVIVVDDLSSGSEGNLPTHEKLTIQLIDLFDTSSQIDLSGVDTIFHLAAIHGGRGFIEKNSTSLLKNLTIDFNTFSQAKAAGVKTIVFASSACAYPTNLQDSTKDLGFLTEIEAGKMDQNPMPDGMYGWTKLIGEYQLEKFAHETNIVARAARIFTAYGERENESHAAIALIAKGLLQMDPYPVWGDGEQTRNFTYVSDTVTGLLCLGAEKKFGFEICNIGTDTHTTVNHFISEVFKCLNWEPNEVDHQLDKPAGVASRSSNNSNVLEKFSWQPQVEIAVGIARTLDWYKALPSRPMTVEALEAKLMAR